MFLITTDLTLTTVMVGIIFTHTIFIDLILGTIETGTTNHLFITIV